MFYDNAKSHTFTRTCPFCPSVLLFLHCTVLCHSRILLRGFHLLYVSVLHASQRVCTVCVRVCVVFVKSYNNVRHLVPQQHARLVVHQRATQSRHGLRVARCVLNWLEQAQNKHEDKDDDEGDDGENNSSRS